MPLLSVIVPVYNEVRTIGEILNKVNALNLDKEIIVVEDGSTDGTDKVLRGISYPNLKIIYHGSNRGKGAAFLTGLANATGEFVIIQDADLEYEPQECVRLMEVMRKNAADIVLGVRFTEKYHGLLIPRMGNRFLTIFLNLLFNVRINDFLTCYKLFRRETISSLGIKSPGFDMDAEIVTKALKKKMRIEQVPISYQPRNYAQGKKIRWLDGIHAMLAIVRYRFWA
ncbi:MAG TPA: glycosyltransferase family 2 protein [Candidatus Margulisiibacteriota bacterium]|nr:glycosyltransferase family 2 protein [Candidatus Margulisiibacteriota bacterium]